MTRLLNSIRDLFTLPAQTPSRPNEASPYEIKAETEWIDSTLGVVAVVCSVYAVGGLAVWALIYCLLRGRP